MVTTTECNFNLNRPGCLEFCSNPDNRCSDDSNVQYCVAKFARAKRDYPDMDDVENLELNVPECKCLMMGPSTRLERKLEQVNHGNRACWSPYCRDGTSPKLDQLSKPSWWIDMQKCAAVNFCILNINDTTINQYGNSVIKINNCDEEQLKESEEDLQSTGEKSGVEITNSMKFAIACGIMLVFLFISKSSSKVKKVEKDLSSLKKSIGLK